MSFYARLVWFLERICTALFIFMTLLLFVQVVLRYLFAESIFWADEAARYSMIWLVFLGAIVAACQGAHTRIGFFVDLLPMVPRRYMEASVTLICAIASGIIAVYGLNVVRIAMMTKSPALRIPLGYVYGAVPVCCGIIALIMLARAVLQFTNRRLPEQIPTEEVQS